MTRLFIITLCLNVATAWAQETSHFRCAEIPRSESRLSELASVREFRIDYDLAHPTHGTMLLAEVFRDGKCVDRFRLSHAIYVSKTEKIGVISIGWQRDTHNLVSVHDNGTPLSPYTASAHLPDFSPFDAYYFSDSLPEKRKSEKKDGFDFELFPVIGLCGDRITQIDYPKRGDAQAFLKACSSAGVKDAVVVYLYFSPFDEEPGLKFTK